MKHLMLNMMLMTAVLASPAAAAVWENTSMLTVYRVTPVDVEGLADMDTADAPGDVVSVHRCSSAALNTLI